MTSLELCLAGCHENTIWYQSYFLLIWLAHSFRLKRRLSDFKLINIVGAQFFKMVELWCLYCIMMMFRWINKKPGIQKAQKFWHLCSHYQDIYDWQLNKPWDLCFILTQQSIRWIQSLVWLHLIMSEAQFFFRASFLHHITDTDSNAMQLIFLTILNNVY